jgi:hypothetical protein
MILASDCEFQHDKRGRGGRDRMVVGYTTTCAISDLSPLKF